jgi:zinc protease
MVVQSARAVCWQSYSLLFGRALMVGAMCVGLGCTGGSFVEKPRPDAGLEPTPFVPVEPLSWTTPDGVSVVYLPDQELPIISVSVAFPGGSYRARNPLAARIMGALLRRGGAGNASREEIDKDLRERSARIEASTDGESVSIAANCLKGDEGRVAEIMNEMIGRPRFAEEEFALVKKQLREQIVRRKDDPDSIAGLVFGQLLYGTDSPYVDTTTVGDVERLTRADVAKEHRRLVGSNGAIVAISGDLTRDEAASVVDRITRGVVRTNGSHAMTSESSPGFPPIKGKVRPGAYFVEGPFSQATVIVGQLGVARLSPDWFDILVFNEIFGSGSMSSRLFAEVRTRRGLAYVSGGAISPGVVQGKNYLYVQTKSASVGEAIDASVGVLEGMQQSPVADDAVSDRKRALTNSFVFANQSPADIVSRRAAFQLQGYPADYDTTFVANLAKVNPARIEAVAKNRWNTDDFVVVVVGDATARESLRGSRFVQSKWAGKATKTRSLITELRFDGVGSGVGIR